MKGLRRLLLFAMLATLAASMHAQPFTYQGYLRQSGVPQTGVFDFQFRLYNQPLDGNQVGSTLTVNGVNVNNGLFQVELDFGAVWDGNPRFLEIAVRRSNESVFVTLSPRVKITPTPYASYAGRVPWSGVIGAPSAFPPTGSASGDLAGSYPNPTVVGLQGRPVSNAVPQTGQTLRWSGSAWQPATVNEFSLPFEASGVTGAASDDLDPTALLKLTNTSSSRSVAAVYGIASATTSRNYGLFGLAAGNQARGIYGYATSTTGGTAGVFGRANSVSGTGVWGIAVATTGVNYGVRGATSSPDGYAGYFEGRGYFSGNVGIGVLNPAVRLDVDGVIRSTGFQLATSTQPGYVLTSDAAGNASWQPVSITGIAAGGDLSGVYPNPSVRALLGRPLSPVAPSPGQTLKWIGGQWTPANDEDTTYTAGAGLQLAGTTFSIASGGITTSMLADGAVTNAKIESVSWSKITDAPTSFPPTGAAGGDLSGNYPNPQVARLLGRPLQFPETIPNGWALKWDANANHWTPAPDENTTYSAGAGLSLTGTTFSIADGGVTSSMLADGAVTTAKLLDNAVTNPKIQSVSWTKIFGVPSGTGDVQGTYPSLQVRGLQGRPVSSAAPQVGQVLKWNGSAWAPGTDNSPNLTAFTHTVSASNIPYPDWFITYIDHPSTNNNPNAILIITPRYPGGLGGPDFAGPVGVFYDNFFNNTNKWAIYYLDLGSEMEPGLQFNVLVIQP